RFDLLVERGDSILLPRQLVEIATRQVAPFGHRGKVLANALLVADEHAARLARVVERLLAFGDLLAKLRELLQRRADRLRQLGVRSPYADLLDRKRRKLDALQPRPLEDSVEADGLVRDGDRQPVGRLAQIE